MVSRAVTRAKHWVQASRPLAQINIAVPLLLGQAAAWHVCGAFEFAWFAAAFAWGVLDHLFIIFGNDYADRGSDSGPRTPISGGSGVIGEGKISATSIKRAAIASALSLVAWSCVLVAYERPWTPVYAAAAIALLWLYSYAPARLSYRGGGELLQAVGMGVVLPSLGFYLQCADFLAPLWVLAPATILGFCGNVLSALPDLESDTRAGKRTWPVRVGVPPALRTASIGVAFAGFAAFLWTPDTGVQVRALIGIVPLIPLVIASRQSNPLAAAWWASGAIHGLLISWVVALAT
ncbi:MAG: prenyltransferase [Polyangiales bacterium]